MSWETTKWFLLAFVLLILNWLVRLPDDAFQGLRYLLWVCWTVSVLLLIFFAVCAVGNIVIVVRGYLYQERASLAPLLGGIAGAVGVLLLPWPAARSWWWLPLLLDLGCVPAVASTLLFLFVRRFRRRT
jgi:hypothetical protein